MKNLPSINLLRARQKGFVDKFLNWALSIGRVVVILTETVALSAFLYRFSLDRQLIDLHDEIEQKQAIVKLLKANEDKYRNFQERLTTIKTLGLTAGKTTKIFTEIVSLAPSNLTFNSLTLSGTTIRADASAQSIASLTAFIKRLRSHPSIQSVSLDKIESKVSSATITLSLTATLNQE